MQQLPLSFPMLLIFLWQDTFFSPVVRIMTGSFTRNLCPIQRRFVFYRDWYLQIQLNLIQHSLLTDGLFISRAMKKEGLSFTARSIRRGNGVISGAPLLTNLGIRSQIQPSLLMANFILFPTGRGTQRTRYPITTSGL